MDTAPKNRAYYKKLIDDAKNGIITKIYLGVCAIFLFSMSIYIVFISRASGLAWFMWLIVTFLFIVGIILGTIIFKSVTEAYNNYKIGQAGLEALASAGIFEDEDEE